MEREKQAVCKIPRIAALGPLCLRQSAVSNSVYFAVDWTLSAWSACQHSSGRASVMIRSKITGKKVAKKGGKVPEE